jgi:hypothetical protein
MTPLPPEQQICIACGFCCDGTLFDNATLQPGEMENLPEELRKNCYDKGKGAFFHLPCQYFSGKCTIYSSARLQICSRFCCRLLTDFERQLVSSGTVYSIIRNVRVHLKDIFEISRDVFQFKENVTFRELQQMLGRLPEEGTNDIRKKMLAGRCNILDALLTKYFKTENDFKKMITTEDSMT